MSDTRYAKVGRCRDCAEFFGPFYCGRDERMMDNPDTIDPACPIFRLRDIPEVRALREAARLVMSKENPCSFEWDDLSAALEAFDKGEEK